MRALEAFLAVQTQWRWVAGMGGMRATGLDYAAVKDGLALAGIEVTPELMRELRAIELGARSGLNGEEA